MPLRFQTLPEPGAGVAALRLDGTVARGDHRRFAAAAGDCLGAGARGLVLDLADLGSMSGELAAEIASSSVSYDLGDKLQVFRRHGVREYIVWRVLDREMDWFVSRAGRFEKLPLDGSGWQKSEVFPGLWLDVPAMLRGDLAAVRDHCRRIYKGDLQTGTYLMDQLTAAFTSSSA
ncbi:hypothetical protein HGA89_02975 [bacterium]|nr:hypothetical protein [bacterium]